MVSPAGADVPWEGRDRLDVSVFPRPAFAVVERQGEVVLDCRHCRLRSVSGSLGRWTSHGKTFAADRPT